MQLNDEQYDRIAQWLDATDGDRPALSDVELAAAEEIRAEMSGDQAAMTDMLNVAAPPESLARAQRRMTAALARPALHTRWFVRAAAVAAIVAIVATASMLTPTAAPVVEDPVATTEMPAETMGQIMAQAAEADVLDLLADELASIATASLVAMDDEVLDMRIDAIEDDLLEGSLIDDTMTWLLDDEGLSS